MAGAITQVGSQKGLDTMTGKTPYGQPTLWFALVKTSTPTAASFGTEYTGTDYTGYARQSITFAAATGTTTYTAASSNAQDFGVNTSGSGGNLTGWAIFDSQTTGGSNNYLWYGTFSSTVNIATNTRLIIPTAQVSLTLVDTSGFGNTYGSKILNHMSGQAAYGAAPSLWFALTTGGSPSTATGIVSETTYTNYARVLISTATGTSGLNALDATTSGGVCALNSVLSWPACGVTGATITGWAVMDAVSSGALVFFQATNSTVISTGFTPVFAAASNLFSLT